MRLIKVLVVILVLLVLFIVLWQNVPPILEKDIAFRLNLYWWSWESKPIPVYLIVPLSFLAGVLLMGLFDLATILRLRHRVRALDKELRSYAPAGTYTSELPPVSDTAAPLEEKADPVA
ncbi:MAG: LapA family protein [bacterium]